MFCVSEKKIGVVENFCLFCIRDEIGGGGGN